MAKLKSTKTYEEMKQELDNVMLSLQREDIDVDEAVEQYQRGLELLEATQAYLKAAENKVSELKNKFEAE